MRISFFPGIEVTFKVHLLRGAIYLISCIANKRKPKSLRNLPEE